MMANWNAPRPRSRPADERAREHAALASPARLRLLDLLIDHAGPVHADDLAATLQLHPSTVRGHLTLLVDAGFVDQVIEHRPHPGRPRVLYAPTAKSRVGTAGCLGYRTLAHVLSSYLHEEARDPATTGERAGRSWAAHLTRDEHPVGQAPGAALDRASEVLESVGFATEIEDRPDGPALIQKTCPFAGVVDEHAEIVCGLHRGLLQGVLDGLGTHLEVTQLTVAIPERACIAQLRSTAVDW